MTSLKTQIYDLEVQLLQPEVRRSAERISELLSRDFVEFCSSGKIYVYHENDVFDGPRSAPLDCEIQEFSVRLLAPGLVLATYKAIKHTETSEPMKRSLRSSIWQYSDGHWKMVFHQGTPGAF